MVNRSEREGRERRERREREVGKEEDVCAPGTRPVSRRQHFQFEVTAAAMLGSNVVGETRKKTIPVVCVYVSSGEKEQDAQCVCPAVSRFNFPNGHGD